MQRSPELQAMLAGDAAAIEDKRARRRRRLTAAGLLSLGAALAYGLLLVPRTPTVESLQSDEEFTTTQFRPPSFLREAEPERQAEPDILRLPEPPVEDPVEPVPEPSRFEVPPPPDEPLPAPDAAVAPLQQEDFPSRYLSKQIVLDTAAGAVDDPSRLDGDDAATVAGDDRHSRFLASAQALGDRTAVARRLERLDALVAEGTLIPGILETAINSDLPGQIRAIVSQDVYSFDGRRVLIPAGTRLIGEYQADTTRGQRRIFVVWARLLRDDGVSVRLASIGADGLGRSGLTGQVDNKWRERFGSAILLSVIGAGSSYLTGYGASQYDRGEDLDDAARGAELARQTIAETFSDMANQVLSENLQIPPTIHVHQGERIFVYVRQDLDFSSLYPDPLDEALREIQHERKRAQARRR
ncbi:type IV secretion system protein VirB10 [Pseudorhizobium pelagicum]|uniref:Conjugal transfer protein TrbI n=1 Tax=Pseudorhizobium pelagicum TaxID=1509405 RepID=A0A922TA70_9HYPH|nr:type IV secretion system protein VirB10 [Pseudorhizobium pelagicum]KEQ04775.1 conjugal transfer protein TrbI [Pseudorhizobium pelagicum]KEQ07376.1 conjugal transfer protein TrbI [Pseudorhizobium pelagicum]